jgi:hypothetical protein
MRIAAKHAAATSEQQLVGHTPKNFSQGLITWTVRNGPIGSLPLPPLSSCLSSHWTKVL